MCNIVKNLFKVCGHKTYQNTASCPLATDGKANYSHCSLFLFDRSGHVPEAALKCPKKRFPVRPQEGNCPACKKAKFSMPEEPGPAAPYRYKQPLGNVSEDAMEDIC